MSEGDKPRQIDTDAPSEMTHNQYPRDEQYVTSEIVGSPRHPAGGTDQQQIRQLTQPEAPNPPIGPETMSGGTFDMPTPPVPNPARDPTAEGGGMYGGVEEARDKTNNQSDDKSKD